MPLRATNLEHSMYFFDIKDSVLLLLDNNT